MTNSTFIPFSAKTRMSGIDFTDGNGRIIRSVRKGAVDGIKKHIEDQGEHFPERFEAAIQSISNKGGTPLLVADDNKVVGIIHLKDVIKGGIKERFQEMRKMGIRTLMVTGDNPLTAAAIAAEAGVNNYIAEATPEIKLARIKKEQEGGRLIAMTGDGTNDAPALAQADVGVAMNTGLSFTRSGKYGRSRQQSHQTHRYRANWQADADDARGVDDVQHRQRRREILCDHPSDFFYPLHDSRRKLRPPRRP